MLFWGISKTFLSEKDYKGSLSKPCPAESFGGRDSVKGNRQGSLSRSITRRSGQNCKIIKIIQILILQFCSQLIPKVRRDFGDKLHKVHSEARGFLVLVYIFTKMQKL